MVVEWTVLVALRARMGSTWVVGLVATGFAIGVVLRSTVAVVVANDANFGIHGTVGMVAATVGIVVRGSLVLVPSGLVLVGMALVFDLGLCLELGLGHFGLVVLLFRGWLAELFAVVSLSVIAVLLPGFRFGAFLSLPASFLWFPLLLGFPRRRAWVRCLLLFSPLFLPYVGFLVLAHACPHPCHFACALH